MKEMTEFYETLEREIQACIFTDRGSKIILNDGSYHNDKPVIVMTEVSGEYECGVLKEVADFVHNAGFSFECTGHDDVVIKKL